VTIPAHDLKRALADTQDMLRCVDRMVQIVAELRQIQDYAAAGIAPLSARCRMKALRYEGEMLSLSIPDEQQ
jgi:hypothetical protein